MPSQQDPKSARCVPDPFLLLGVGSGDETMQQIIGKLRKADHSDFDGGEAESLDAAAVKETLIRADEILPCRVLTSNGLFQLIKIHPC